MFRIINISVLIKILVGVTVAFSIALYAMIDWFLPGTSLIKLFTIASAVSAVLITAVSSSFISRKIWSLLSLFDGSLFPDINGAWEGEITFGETKLVTRAIIRQTLSYTQIDLHTPTSKSITLESTPVTEGGQARLYYVHRVTPRNPDWYTYTGSTLFDIRRVEIKGNVRLELSGSYYTDRKTTGRIRLQQFSKEVTTDVSYY
ncbi:MAG: hypothetical protein CVU31_00065 [Betaproteobacteria bacterium HGW-Betaproteobacteria-4]|jgi:hypothetical protein|nr:MAG: hypothetical protein CVU31_00065 [Betaproteobacteria bacterium HGW-Betaproteobacteria-4]